MMNSKSRFLYPWRALCLWLVLLPASFHFLALGLHGGGPPLDFAKMLDSLRGLAIASDSEDNIYVGSGPYDALIKFDANGQRLWTFGLPPNGSGHIHVRGIVVDETGDLFVCGDVWGIVSIGKLNHDRGGSSGMFFGRFTPGGSNVFATIFYNLHSKGKPLVRTADGGFMVVGFFDYEASYEGITVSSVGRTDVLAFKINADGSPVWVRRGTGAEIDLADGVASVGSGGAAIVGSFYSSSLGIGGLIIPSIGNKTHYLVRLDSDGGGMWSQSAGSTPESTSYPISSAVAVSPVNNSIIWAADFSGSLALSSPPALSTGGKDVFVANLTPTGTVLWVRTLTGVQDQFVNAACVDSFGNIYVAGVFSGEMVVGTLTLTSLGGSDIFIVKLRDNGMPIWAKRIGWSANDGEASLALTKSGALLVSGTVSGGISIEGTFLEGSLYSDAFFAKFRSEAVPPRFVTHPESQVISAGMTLTLSAGLDIEDASTAFQWWFNGSPVVRGTNSTLTITGAQPTDAGNYYLEARTEAGMAESQVALVSYTEAATMLISVHPSLTLFGTPGRTYKVEYSIDLRGAVQWMPATNLTLSASPQVWIDPTAAIGERRFYRVVLLP
jgi:hypothetical protein